jgi:uncharacterized protein (TIGR00290 family)
MKRAFASWSGGKDCCQSVYRAMQQGFKIQCLLNTVTQDGERSCSHGISARWIQAQSEAMGIPVIQVPTTGDNYEAVFSNSLRKLKSEGINYGIFGDIDFEPHREWIERVCASAGIMPVLPLWKKSQDKLVREFIDLGFVSVVVATQTDLLEEEWLGRKVDSAFLSDLQAYDETISPCGEAGEFHTLVVDGPLFKKRLEIRKAYNVLRNNNWFLDIKQLDLIDK